MWDTLMTKRSLYERNIFLVTNAMKHQGSESFYFIFYFAVITNFLYCDKNENVPPKLQLI